jgi:cell division protein FtsL
MRKTLILLAVISIPAILALSSWQSSRFDQLSREIAQLEKEQRTLLGKNKQLITEIAVYSSVQRIEERAKTTLNMSRIPSSAIVQVQIQKKGADK